MRSARTIQRLGMRICAAAILIALGAVLSPQGQDWAVQVAIPHDPVLTALTNNDLEGLRQALNQGAPAEMQYPSGGTPLIVAAGGADTVFVAELLAHGAKANTAGNLGFTPLHAAAMSGNLESVRLLLEYGAEVNAATTAQITPLLTAARNGDRAMVALLLDHGAVVDMPAGCGKRALVEVAQAPGTDPELMLMLISAGANVNGADANGITPLQAAMRAQRHDLVKVLLGNGAQEQEVGPPAIAISPEALLTRV